ncbi:MAG: hypothetical protein WCO64_03965 [Actinomycetes bacterium]
MSNEIHEMDESELWEALQNAAGYERADILRHIATWRAGDGDNEQALELLDESCRVFADVKDTREQGITRNVAGKTLEHLDRHNDARSAYLEAADLLYPHGLANEIADCYFNASGSSRSLNQYDVAADQMSKARDFYLSAGSANTTAIASAGRELGWLLQHIGGRDDEALDAFEQALDVSKSDCAPHFVNDIREKYLRVLCDLHKYDEALVQARQSIAVCRACSCGNCVIGATLDIAMVYQRLGDTFLATKYSSEALELAKSSNHMGFQLRANLFFAGQHIKSDPLEARKLLKECVDFAHALGNDAALAAAYRWLGTLDMKEESYGDAAEHFSQCANIWNEQGELAYVATAQRLQACALLKADKIRNALQVIQANAWVHRDGFLASTDLAEHHALYAKALLADGQKDAAVERAEWILRNMDVTEWFHIQGMAHEVRAYGLRHREPQVSDRAATRALASYVASGKISEAKAIAFEFVIDPYLVLQKIDVDNLQRAQTEQDRSLTDEGSNLYVLGVVADMDKKDPILAQLDNETNTDSPDHSANDASLDEPGTGTLGPNGF